MKSPTNIPVSLCLLVGVSVGPIREGMAADWPRWFGPDGTGIAQESFPLSTELESVSWRSKVGIGYSSIAIAGDHVYTMGHDGRKVAGRETVWCLDAKSGEVVWSNTYEAELLPNLHEGGPAATPTVDGVGRVYTLSKDGRLHCYDGQTGERKWLRNMMMEAGMRRPPEWGFAGSPLVLGEQLIVEAGATFALDRKNGEVLWKSRPYTPAYGSPAVFTQSGVVRIAVLKTEGLVVLNAADGADLAFTEWKTAFSTNANTPTIREGKIFVSTGYDRGCALFEFDGSGLSKRYENRSMCNHINNSVLFDRHLYGFDGTAHRGRPTEFVCLEWATGKEKWRVPPEEGLGCGSVIATRDGTLIVLTERGELLTAPASPEAFEPAARSQVLGGRCWTSPALADGKIFVRNARGDLACVAVR